MSAVSRYCAIVPAAGIGRRFGGALPKQYLTVAGMTVMEHSLRLLLSVPQLTDVVVAVHPDDTRWCHLTIFNDPRIHVVSGGDERCHSVVSGLRWFDERHHASDWALVHDVARPCCPLQDIEQLIRATADHAVGGLLALPVSDTLKRVGSDHTVVATVERAGLWRAQTPQLFRRSLLQNALEGCLDSGPLVTDEAQAIESQGLRPLVVEGSRRNIKITRPDDLALADYYLTGGC